MTSLQSTLNSFTNNLLRDTGVLVSGLATTIDPVDGIEAGDPDLVPPPWKVFNRSALEVAQFPVEAVRPYIPSGLEIVQTWPGYTPGMVMFVSYSQTPVGPYNEFVLAPALVKYRDAVGFWVSQMDVDSEVSRKGGRFNWGLPKELRSFAYNWSAGRADLKMQAEGNGQTWVEASYTNTSIPGFELPDWLPHLSTITYKSGLFYRTPIQLSGKATPASFRILTYAPGTGYDLITRRQPLFGVSFESSRLVVEAPEPIIPVMV
ncbi:acetoacetate decarboxylase family protein [Leptolyngbya sp. FACHB-261]|uniref:acetoacetate decarboxylase family protein n=1 Tax=Leptolyngbya sp. FACHB-261 TaxID=2692806 RepID=UPI0016850C25|nr:acetoacetate decarboxylase family protein [Leptolyngbya sp. FACHB-261]MBD2101961.1 acetoacetate decarboxylase family protein [Leptolyngbya sp. FACHB-261]